MKFRASHCARHGAGYVIMKANSAAAALKQKQLTSGARQGMASKAVSAKLVTESLSVCLAFVLNLSFWFFSIVFRSTGMREHKFPDNQNWMNESDEREVVLLH